ncbi:hypothetical protein PLCT2_02239 [Planctomycetaceae bacterium]|nr:hypothetical protein PLCT2_02239 [Planctomycetaceae bacterium]
MEYELTKDDDAVLDYVSKLRESLAPAQGTPSEDRVHAQEMKAMAAQISAMQIAEPEMGVRFTDVLAKASVPTASIGAAFDRWTSGWRLAAAFAACFCLTTIGMVVIAGLTGGDGRFAGPPLGKATGTSEAAQVEQGRVKLPDAMSAEAPQANPPEPHFKIGTTGNLDTLMRSGTLGLRDENPAAIQRKITDALILAGGQITSLSRNGTGKDTVVRIDLAVTADKYLKFVNDISAYGEVIAQTEQAVDAGGDLINNEAALAEAQDYLKRLEALIEKGSNSLSEMQRLEAERRSVIRETERIKRTQAALKDRVAMARLSVTISAVAPAVAESKGDFEAAFDDGWRAFTKISAFLLKALIASLPILLVIVLAVLIIKRIRRSRMYR